MDKKQKHKLMRSHFSPVGWSMLAYYLLMNVCVIAILYASLVYQSILAEFTGTTVEQVVDSLASNAWGYLICIGMGFLLMWLWKGSKFCTKELWTRGRPMKVGDFFSLLAVFMMGQTLFSLLSLVQELILNQFGFTAIPAVESATANADSLSMFLYVGFGAPIAEEILCRGLILRPMVKYGKRFAILMSAFFFGLLHGNVVQTPFAFVVGLILGYVAVEYNVIWAMVLHMINNLVVGDLLVRLLGEVAGNSIVGMLNVGLCVAGVIILILRRHEIRSYIKENMVDNEAVLCFFTSPGVIVAFGVLMFNMVTNFFAMQ